MKKVVAMLILVSWFGVSWGVNIKKSFKGLEDDAKKLAADAERVVDDAKDSVADAKDKVLDAKKKHKAKKTGNAEDKSTEGAKKDDDAEDKTTEGEQEACDGKDKVGKRAHATTDKTKKKVTLGNIIHTLKRKKPSAKSRKPGGVRSKDSYCKSPWIPQQN